MKKLQRYLLNILIWLDQGMNVFLFAGCPHETVSSRLGKHADKGEKWACVLCALLAKIFGPNHCKEAQTPDYDEAVFGE